MKTKDMFSNQHLDPAAVLGIAISLNSELPKETNVSEAYQGADEFMRQCMRVAAVFESWASRFIDFEGGWKGGVWPYDLQDHFAKAYLIHFGACELTDFKEKDCPAVYASLNTLVESFWEEARKNTPKS